MFLFYYKEIYRRSGSRQNNNRADHNIQPQIGGFFLLLGFVVYFLILVFIGSIGIFVLLVLVLNCRLYILILRLRNLGFG